ncbi:MAG TPA: hypothetical protein DCP90_06005 [Clostridiales bacterium]|nr:MAG: hypothetical protein A2Y22_09295 [Clostridiales bacterium GWD2_32_59]HAN10147.1 hypothetical protein [Clostridiales bacterium]
MAKEKLIILEGPQGVGKTGLTNWLREKIVYTNLYRLTGSKYKTEEEARKRSEIMYKNLVNYVAMMEDCGVNLLFDRIFITEYVYCRLGYRSYDYSKVFKSLITKIDLADFDIYLFNLKIRDVNLFAERMERGGKPSHHALMFNIENSTKQQHVYDEVMNEIKSLTENIKVIDIYTDSFDEAKADIAKLLEMKEV